MLHLVTQKEIDNLDINSIDVNKQTIFALLKQIYLIADQLNNTYITHRVKEAIVFATRMNNKLRLIKPDFDLGWFTQNDVIAIDMDCENPRWTICEVLRSISAAAEDIGCIEIIINAKKTTILAKRMHHMLLASKGNKNYDNNWWLRKSHLERENRAYLEQSKAGWIPPINNNKKIGGLNDY